MGTASRHFPCIASSLNFGPGLKKIQIIQDTGDNFRIRFVRGESFRPADAQFLAKRLDERFGPLYPLGLERGG